MVINNKIARGYGRPTALIVGRQAKGSAPTLDRRLPVDLMRAKKLMEQAGYAIGFEVVIDCLNITPSNEYCQALASVLAPIGVKLKLSVVAFANVFQTLRKFDTSAYVNSYGTPTMNAYFPLEALLRSVGEIGSVGFGRGKYNLGRYSNTALDTLLDRIKVEMDLSQRNALIAEALAIARDDLSVILFLQQIGAWALRKNINAPAASDARPHFYRFRDK